MRAALTAPSRSALDPRPRIRDDTFSLVVFFALACAFSWAYWVPVALSGSVVERGAGWPTQLPGLLGPMLAAFVVVAFTEGRTGARSLVASMLRWPRGARALFAAGAPLVFLALALAIAGVFGMAPAASDFLRYSGTSAAAVALIAALVIGGFGEETGWRGYALVRLQRRHGPIRATLTVTAGWAIWHIPLFFILASYANFGPLMALGWLIGLTAGGFVLTAVFNFTGGSVLAVVIWHATYNAAAGTAAGDGLIAPIVTACVIFWAVSLVKRHRRGLPAFASPQPAAGVTASRHRGTRAHMRVSRMSGGRMLGRMGGQPVLLLQTVGRRTRRTPTTPLQYLPRDCTFVVVAANHGAPPARLVSEPLAPLRMRECASAPATST